MSFSVAEQKALRKKLMQECYLGRGKRLRRARDEGKSTLEVLGFTKEELMFLLPGRKIEWLTNVARLTPYPDRPVWLENEAIFEFTTKRLVIDDLRGLITFQDRDTCQTRTVRMKNIFTLTVELQPRKAVEIPTVKMNHRGLKKIKA